MTKEELQKLRASNKRRWIIPGIFFAIFQGLFGIYDGLPISLFNVCIWIFSGVFWGFLMYKFFDYRLKKTPVTEDVAENVQK